MNGTETKVGFARELAAALEGSVDHAFVHGLERFPHAMGRDLDVLVRHDQRKEAVEAARQRFERMGWSFRAHWRLNGHVWCFVAPPDRHLVLEFDLIDRLRWASALLVDRPRVTARMHGFRVDPWASFVKRILIQVLGGGIERFGERAADLEISSAERATVPARLEEHLGRTLAGSLMDAVERRDIGRLGRLRTSLQRAAILRSIVQRPLSAGASIFDWSRNELASSFLAARVFPIVGLVGVDGVGKSSVIAALAQEMRARLPILRLETRHWRPRVLPSLRRVFGGDGGNEHLPGPPRRTPGRGSLFRVAYYGLDYLLGGARDRHVVAQLGAVIYDRCALDMQVDPVRFGLRTPLATGVLRRLTSGPHLVVLLHDEPQRIHARKPELSIAEIDRLQAAWLALANRGDLHLVLAAGESPRALASRIVDHMVDGFFGRSATVSVAADRAGRPC